MAKAHNKWASIMETAHRIAHVHGLKKARMPHNDNAMGDECESCTRDAAMEEMAQAAISVGNEPCRCPQGVCAHFVDPPDACINRLAGDVRTRVCHVCEATTWFQDATCLRCRTTYVDRG